MKRLLLFWMVGMLTWSWDLEAQVSRAAVGINGLTCSQCSRAVYNALSRVSFIESVSMDLNETIAHLSFKQQQEPDFDVLAAAVVDAGYKVRDIKVAYEGPVSSPAGNVLYLKNYCIVLDQTIDPESTTLNFSLLGKNFNADKKANEKIHQIKEATTSQKKCPEILHAIIISAPDSALNR